MPDQAYFIPSFLTGEIYSPWKKRPGFVAEQVERISKEGFFRSVEIGCFLDAADCARIKSVTTEHGVQVAQWMTELQDRDGLDVSATDEALRQRSVEGLKGQLANAAECGATTVALIGGVDPGPGLREKAYDQCYRSLVEVSAAAGDLGMAVMMEPLDRFAHKKRLVGPTDEAVVLFGRVREVQPNFGFAFDTAHSALNEEDIEAALGLAREQVLQIHLANAVLDKQHALYGDNHIMPGAPGFLTVERAAEIIAAAQRLGIRKEQGLRVTVEARAQPNEGEQDTARITIRFLREVLERAQSMLEPS